MYFESTTAKICLSCHLMLFECYVLPSVILFIYKKKTASYRELKKKKKHMGKGQLQQVLCFQLVIPIGY